jgi:hypothetical protein
MFGELWNSSKGGKRIMATTKTKRGGVKTKSSAKKSTSKSRTKTGAKKTTAKKTGARKTATKRSR